MRATMVLVGLGLLAGALGGCGDGGSDGAQPATLDFQVNSSTAGDQVRPAIVELVGGDIVVAWRSSPPEGGGRPTCARGFSPPISPAPAKSSW